MNSRAAFSPDMDALRERVARAIAERVFPGCVIGYIRKDSMPITVAYGSLAYDNRPVEESTVYDLASVTKSIPTASLALILEHEGRVSFTDEVKKYIPELQNDFGATIEDLLRYKVRGPRMSQFALHTFEEIRTHILEHGFDGPPGKSQYTNLPAYLLGVIVERIGGGGLPALAHKYFFDPLGMDQTTYFPTASDCAPTEITPDGETIRGLVHDESSLPFALSRRAVGHAGLFSTAKDMLEFLEALINGRYPAIVVGAQSGLGWVVQEERLMGTHVGEKAFGKSGFTGTSMVVDIEKRAALVILSNRTYPKRPDDAISLTSAINLLRRDIADIVFSYDADT